MISFDNLHSILNWFLFQSTHSWCIVIAGWSIGTKANQTKNCIILPTSKKYINFSSYMFRLITTVETWLMLIKIDTRHSHTHSNRDALCSPNIVRHVDYLFNRLKYQFLGVCVWSTKLAFNFGIPSVIIQLSKYWMASISSKFVWTNNYNNYWMRIQFWWSFRMWTRWKFYF